MPVSLRAVVSKTLAAVPAYRLVPPSSWRTYAALHYHWHNSSPDEIAKAVADGGGRAPVRFLSASLIAARAAFRTAQDDLLVQTLQDLEQRFPDAPAVHELWSDLEVFRGDDEAALARADRARLIDPASPTAWARLVRQTYRTRGREAGDRTAVEATSLFPRSPAVLWAVTKACDTEEQAQRILGAWRDKADQPDDLQVAVRQLSTAAARAGLLDLAIGIYGEAMAQLADGATHAEPATTTQLAGRGAWAAIADLVDVLDGAGVPFFFAAGTALGLVRDGQPLDLDGDIDVGVLDGDYDEEALRAAFAADPRFDFDVSHPRTRKVALRHRGGSPVDIFRFYEEDDRIWHDAVFVRWHNSPFEVRRRTVGGVSVPLPEDEDRYLTENYGDWRTPDAAFDAFTDDAPNVEVTWPEYLDLHLVRRAYRRLTAGDRVAAVTELVAAGRDDLAEVVHGGAAAFATVAKLPPAAEAASPAEAPHAAAATRPRRLSPDQVVAEARGARAEGRRDDAVALLRSEIAGGRWRYGRLWAELVALMETAVDYDAIRSLWLACPRVAHSNPAVLRSVARAAAIGGAHEEARAILRKAIKQEADRRRHPRARLARLKGTLLERRPGAAANLPRNGTDGAPSSFEARAATALRDLNRILGDLDVKPFLISGTLLGFVRDANFIPWDKDIDVGVFAAEVETAKLVETFERAPEFTVRRLDFTTDRLRVNHDNGVMIDVFPHYLDDDGKVWHDGTATRWWNSPFSLKTVEFLGIEQAVPEVPERYLDENYGNWRIPDPEFDARLDAPNLEVIDEAFLDTLLYFDLLRAVIQGKATKRDRYRNLLRERGEGPWLDRV